MSKKSLAHKLRLYITDKDFRFRINAYCGFYDKWDDERYLKAKFKSCFGYELDLNAPETYNEKLNWLKLYDRKPEYTTMVDKYMVKEYVAEKIGAEYVVPLLGVWDDPDEIDFEALPEQFVLKCNHNSGRGMCICRDKSKLDTEAVKAELRKGLGENHYLKAREWPYRDVERKIIAEKLLSDGTDEPLEDYKLLCFNGKVKLIKMNRGRFTNHYTQDFYDENWKLTDFEKPEYPRSGMEMEKPAFADEMFALTEKLAAGLLQIRVDWYYVQGQLYFGELTFFDGGGFTAFFPGQDELIDSWIALPEKE